MRAICHGTTDDKVDKKKVAEDRKVLYTQATERSGRRPTGVKCVDIKKADGRHRNRQMAKEFNKGMDQAMWTVKLATREQERRNTKTTLDVHRALLPASQTTNTYAEVPDDELTEEGKAWSRRCTERRKRLQRGKKMWKRR